MIKLIKFQKLLIKKNFQNGKKITASIPLWIDFEYKNKNETIKNISSKIKRIDILPPETCEIQNNQFITKCPVEISFQEYTVKSSLKLVKSDFMLKNISPEELSFPLSLKIFRIAEKLELSANSQAVQDAVWKKL